LTRDEKRKPDEQRKAIDGKLGPVDKTIGEMEK
jgi:hypothetical protein